MNRILYCVVLALLGPQALGDTPQANDWPQWRGPDRNAVSQETGLLQEWPESGPPLAWRIDGLGGGYGAPSVSGGRMFGMSYRGDEEVVWALDESNGKELWAKPLGPAHREGMPQGREGPGCADRGWRSPVCPRRERNACVHESRRRRNYLAAQLDRGF